MKPAAGLLLAGLLLATPAFALDDPDQLVRAIYRPLAAPITPKDLARYFDADLARALRADSQGEEVGAVDFDYRYDAQDVQITGLGFSKAAWAGNGSLVTARFQNFGKPAAIAYRLCVRAKGWRIVDIAQGDGSWSLRQMLQLPPRKDCALAAP